MPTQCHTCNKCLLESGSTAKRTLFTSITSYDEKPWQAPQANYYQTGAARMLLELAPIATYTNTDANTMSYVLQTSAGKWSTAKQTLFTSLISAYESWRETLASTSENYQAGAARMLHKFAPIVTCMGTDANTMSCMRQTSAGKQKYHQANFIHLNHKLWRESLASTSQNHQAGAAQMLFELTPISAHTNTDANTVSYVQLTSAGTWKYRQANCSPQL